MKDKILSFFSLFASTSTLICCALPALLVTLGFGAVVASTVSALPWLVSLTRNKEWVFLGAGLLITANWGIIWRRKRHAAACTLPNKRGEVATACDMASRFNRTLLTISTAIYILGFTVAYLAFPVLKAMGI